MYPINDLLFRDLLKISDTLCHEKECFLDEFKCIYITLCIVKFAYVTQMWKRKFYTEKLMTASICFILRVIQEISKLIVEGNKRT